MTEKAMKLIHAEYHNGDYVAFAIRYLANEINHNGPVASFQIPPIETGPDGYWTRGFRDLYDAFNAHCDKVFAKAPGYSSGWDVFKKAHYLLASEFAARAFKIEYL